jgi:hypothetical protein
MYGLFYGCKFLAIEKLKKIKIKNWSLIDELLFFLSKQSLNVWFLHTCSAILSNRWVKIPSLTLKLILDCWIKVSRTLLMSSPLLFGSLMNLSHLPWNILYPMHQNLFTTESSYLIEVVFPKTDHLATSKNC